MKKVISWLNELDENNIEQLEEERTTAQEEILYLKQNFFHESVVIQCVRILILTRYIHELEKMISICHQGGLY